MPKAPANPFDVRLSDEQRTTLGIWLGYELQNAIAARSAQETEVEYWWTLYEQGRTRDARNLPWPDAADLTSYIPTEKVDAVHARLLRTIWVNPVWTVEGFGQAADRAPFVEEFHQAKAEEERLQGVLDRVALNALVEPRALLEVYEDTTRRTARKQIDAAPELTEGGGLIFDENLQPQLQLNPQTGEFVPATSDQLAVTTVVDSDEPVRTGPAYRVLPYADSLILPGHARDKEEIWGYAKRLWKRKPDLVRDAANGLYDADAVDRLTDVGDRQPTPSLDRANQGIAPQRGETAEKELWEVLWLVDLNDLLTRHNQTPIRDKRLNGPRWYVATIHLQTHNLLRLNHDDFERSRYVPFILFPRSNRATEGYSFVGNKLLTVTEEHTAYRNMAADRSSMAVNAPVMKLQGALWDEDEQPWGPKAVITVRDPREISQLPVADVPASIFNQIQYCDRTAERLAGVNDLSAGINPQQQRTLGENEIATQASAVRIGVVLARFQEAMEDLAQIRHAIWKRCLAEQPDGVDAPDSLIVGMEGRGVPIDAYLPNGKVTAALLDGPFRFKPYGSDETADPTKRRNDLIAFMQALPMFLQVFPMLAQQLQTPQAARAMFRELLQAFRIRNTQAFLGSPAQDLAQSLPPQLAGFGMGMGLGAPGLPPMGGLPMGAPAPGQAVQPPFPMPSPLNGPPMPMAPQPPGIQ